MTWPLPEDASDSLKRRFMVTYDTNHQHFIAQLTIRDLNFADTNTLMCAYNGTTDLRLLNVARLTLTNMFLFSHFLNGTLNALNYIGS